MPDLLLRTGGAVDVAVCRSARAVDTYASKTLKYGNRYEKVYPLVFTTDSLAHLSEIAANPAACGSRTGPRGADLLRPPRAEPGCRESRTPQRQGSAKLIKGTGNLK